MNLSPENPPAGRSSNNPAHTYERHQEETLTIDRELVIKRRGIGARIIMNSTDARDPDPSLVDLIARAHFYLKRLCAGSSMSITALASELSMDRSDISRILPLAFLSPALVEAILSGNHPAHITAPVLARRDIPPCWTKQVIALGMQNKN